MPEFLQRKVSFVQILLTLTGLILMGLLVRNFSFNLLLGTLQNPLLLGLALSVPYACTFFLDSKGWEALFPPSARPNVRRLAYIRLVSEPFTLTLPGGAVIGETFKAALAGKSSGLTLAESGATVILYRFGMGASQFIFISLGLILAYPLLQRRSVEIIGHAGLGNIVALLMGCFAIILVVLFLVVNLVQPARRFLDVGEGVGSSRWRRRWAEVVRGIHTVEGAIVRHFRDHRRSSIAALSLFFLGWIFGALETFLIVRSLGLPLSVEQAFIVESMGSIFRIVGLFLPSGIGGQDWGYAALLSLYAAQDPLAFGASFVILKRLREFTWIGAGFLTLATTLGGKAARATIAEAVDR